MEFWIGKGKSGFADELWDDGEEIRKNRIEFYDLISKKDTIENGIHVIEYSEYIKALNKIEELQDKIIDLEIQIGEIHTSISD